MNPVPGDTVLVVDPTHPRFGQVGAVDRFDPGAMRYGYRVVFSDGPDHIGFLDRREMQRDLWYSREQLQFPTSAAPKPTVVPEPKMADQPSGPGSNRDELG